ncbi:MAG: ABC transporter permease [Acidobacteria bacterium]|nr:ABC transporter permease [Acidobacteriota bacterium]
MSWINPAKHFLHRLFHRQQVEDDLDEEVRACFDILVERGMQHGLSHEAALRAARVRFEGPEQIKEKVREVRVGAAIDSIVQDIRFAARVLRRDAGFTSFAIITIALALGANGAIFSFVDGVLLKGVDYPEPERIVQIWEKVPRGLRNGIAPANYIDWTRLSKSFEYMAASSGATMSYLPAESSSEPKAVRVGVVSAPYFDVFGTKAAFGRTFASDEDQLGKEKVAVVTHRTWLTQFGGDRNILGQKIMLDGQPYAIIGVLPGASEFDRRTNDFWIPLVFPPNAPRNYHSFSAVARMKRGVTVQQAQAEMTSIAERYPDVKKGWGAIVDLYVDRLVGDQMRLSLQILMWAVIAVLLIGCANLANLLLARSTLRSREMAVRLAMGARRGRIIRMLLTESLLLSAAGAVAGVVLGYGLLGWIRSLLPPFYLPSSANVAMDGRVLLFLSAATLFTCLAMGLAPALQVSAEESAESLKEGGRANTAGRRKMIVRNVFVGVQVAVAFVLLVAGGLLVRSFQKLMSVDIGYQTEGLIAAYLPLPMEKSPEVTTLVPYIERILMEVRSIPGVREAAVTTGLPLRGWGDGMPFRLGDRPKEEVGTGFKIISPRYLQALGLPLKAGRYFDDRDTAGSPPVVVVNESFVRRYYPKGDAIGKHILVEKILPNRRGLGPQTAWEIVGVVVDEKGRGVESSTDVGAYASFTQNPVVRLGIVARGAADAGSLIQAVARAVAKVHKSQVLDRPRTVEELKTEALLSRRLTTSLLGGLAILAMLLACTGIYGVLSFVTARRTHELGIRAVLGASRSVLLRLVAGNGATPVVLGIIAGLLGALAMGRFIQSMLFVIDPIDPLTLAGVSLIFATVALVACVIPAWKASRVEPMAALRHE